MNGKTSRLGKAGVCLPTRKNSEAEARAFDEVSRLEEMKRGMKGGIYDTDTALKQAEQKRDEILATFETKKETRLNGTHGATVSTEETGPHIRIFCDGTAGMDRKESVPGFVVFGLEILN